MSLISSLRPLILTALLIGSTAQANNSSSAKGGQVYSVRIVITTEPDAEVKIQTSDGKRQIAKAMADKNGRALFEIDLVYGMSYRLTCNDRLSRKGISLEPDTYRYEQVCAF